MIKEENPLNIVINTRDIEQHGSKLSCLDIDKNIWVKWGVPIAPGGVFVLGPEQGKDPFVFKVNNLTLKDKEHSEGVVINEAWVLSMHGYRDDKDRWVFGNGQSVVDTVRAVNKELSKREEDPLSAILVCNNSELPLGIKIHDLGTQEGAYAIGDSVHISGVMEENGTFNVTAKADKFENLEIEKLAKEINILDS